MTSEQFIDLVRTEQEPLRRFLLALCGGDQALADDIAGTNKFWSLVISLYEEDGTWLRTLARAPFADFCASGVLVFSGLGIALLAPDATLHQGTRIIEVATPHPLPHTFSPTIPRTINPTQTACGTDSFSWNRKIPRTDVPTIPKPVHIA